MKKFIISLLLVALCLLPVGSVTALAAASQTPAAVIIDKTYLSRAVVSSRAVELKADVRNADNQRLYGKIVSFSLTEGEENAGNKGGKPAVCKGRRDVYRKGGVGG